MNRVASGRTRHANVYAQLRLDILEGRMRPGERLQFDHLRERYAAAVGPLREALMRLIPDGLVVLEEHKGFTVAGVSRNELLDITAVRKIVEPVAIQRSIERGDDRWEADILARFHELTRRSVPPADDGLDTEWEERHQRFHSSLYAACGSERLMRYCDQLREQTDRYRRLWFQHLSTTRDVAAEHREIMDAVIQRDSAAAAFLVNRHIGHTATALIEFLE